MLSITSHNLLQLTRPTPDFGGLVPSLYCSWAVWAEQDVSGNWYLPPDFDRASALEFPVHQPDAEFPRELVQQLHTRAIFVGLAPGESGLRRVAGVDDWLPFHAPGRSRDDRVAEALRGTPLWGSFMTDLLPLIHRDKSLLLSGWLKDPRNTAEITENFAAWEWLVQQIGALTNESNRTPPILCFGAQTYAYAQLFLTGNKRLTAREYTVIKLDSYSPANRKINTVSYRDLVIQALEMAAPELLEEP
ncbi:hypothetical protein [Rothia sp. ZJ1223]|uniref:hypothetical protein n=1 Tax=Rothia sp. ZJ1223 TaxID=2811098 RepID=UPI0019560301|nr:hypothetical protein [Rothia sp. ZJ1223]MBM7050650.1 hypothetical protein [Rothia sp. ZJ1223]